MRQIYGCCDCEYGSMAAGCDWACAKTCRYGATDLSACSKLVEMAWGGMIVSRNDDAFAPLNCTTYFSRNFENCADKALAKICKTLQIRRFILNYLCRLSKFKEQKYKLQIFIAWKNRIWCCVNLLHWSLKKIKKPTLPIGFLCKSTLLEFETIA